MRDFKNKVVVITGAANGLGKALANEFYRQGSHLALIDIDLAGLLKMLEKFSYIEQRVTIHHTNVSQENSIEEVRLDILKEHNHIDILVNNAAISISQPFEQVDLADYRQLFEINFWGTVYCSRHFLADLKSRPDTRLVNIISDFALIGFPGKTTYGSSKSAVMGFTNSLKTELPGTPVKVCLVIPPPMDTGIVKNSKHVSDEKRERETLFLQKNGMPPEKAAKRIVKQIQKGRYRIVVGSFMFWIDLVSRLFPSALNNLIGRNKKRIDFV